MVLRNDVCENADDRRAEQQNEAAGHELQQAPCAPRPDSFRLKRVDKVDSG